MAGLIPEDFSRFKPMKPEVLRRVIGNYQWHFARTMPSCPHWYALRKEVVSDLVFCRFVKQIRFYGYDWRWGPYLHRYLDVDGFRYWTMGYQIESTILINGAKNENGDRPHEQNPNLFMAKRWHGPMFKP